MSEDQKWKKPNSGKPKSVKPQSRKLKNGGNTNIEGHFRTNNKSGQRQSSSNVPSKSGSRQSNNTLTFANAETIEIIIAACIIAFVVAVPFIKKGGKKVTSSILKRTK